MAYSLAEKLYANKSFTKTVEVLGLKVEFQRLSAPDEDEIIRSLNPSGYMDLFQARKIPTLARAIKRIDGVEWKDFDEIKQRLLSKPEPTLAQAIEAELRSPEKYPEEVVTALYIAYSDFLNEYRAVLEGVKKTSAPLNPETVG